MNCLIIFFLVLTLTYSTMSLPSEKIPESTSEEVSEDSDVPNGQKEDCWEKMNVGKVCFCGRNNRPGIFKPRYPGFLAAVKLIHHSGKITCDYRLSRSHYSNWGCHRFPHIQNTPLNVFVTDENNQVLFPKVEAKFTTGVHRGGKWYSISGFNSKSKYLVLQRSFNTPFYIGPKTSLKVWYGEDLFNYAEGDNRGRICADVYGYFV